MARFDSKTGLCDDDFVKLYLHDIAKLKALTNQQRMALDFIATKIRFKSNEVHLNSNTRKEMAEYLETSDVNVRYLINALTKKKIIFKTDTLTVYIMNPDIICKGSVTERVNAIHLILKYTNKGVTSDVKYIQEKDGE